MGLADWASWTVGLILVGVVVGPLASAVQNAVAGE